MHVAQEALRYLPIDAVWFMVSPGNPHKLDSDMAPFEARLDSARDLADSHPALFASDIETRLGTQRTADTLFALKTALPATRFVWIMGADNLKTFHTWYRWRDIVHALPIAIFDRPGYSEAGSSSRMAARYRKFRKRPGELTSVHGPAWAFVRIPRHPASATVIREHLGPDWALGSDRGNGTDF